MKQRKSESPLPASLRRQWVFLALLSLLFWTWGQQVLAQGLPDGWAYVWAIGTGPLLLLWLAWIHRALPQNHGPSEPTVFPALPLATWITWFRGLAVLAAIGFVGLPPLPGFWAWVPPLLYLLGVALDYVDGWVARRTRRVTVMGQTLDVALDGMAVLGGAVLAWRYGKVPGWYLLVGLARYLYLSVEGWRRRRGLPVHPLPTSMVRRALAGIQMGFLAVVLWPIFTPPATYWAAYAFGLPFLVHFLWDGLTMVGWISQDPKEEGRGVGARVRPVIPFVRLGARWISALWVAMVLFPWWATWTRSLPPPAGSWGRALLLLLLGTAVVGLAVGWMARTWALVALGLWGWALHLGFPWNTVGGWPLVWLVLVFYLGGGGLWEPEEALWSRWRGGHPDASSSS